MIGLIFVNIVGAVVFLFLLWRQLKEDYLAQQVFTAGLYVIFGIVIATVVANRFSADHWFWLSLVLGSLGLLVAVKRFKMRLYETLQAISFSILPWLTLVFLHHAVSAKSLGSFLGTVFLVILIGFFLYLDQHYKKFTWYKSGRIGFAGLTTLGVFFLVRTAVAPFAGSVLSFAGRFEVFASGLLALGIFLLLLKLSKTA